MIRFILNFFLFGILFFLIWRFFPQAFETLVGWAGAVYDFFAALFQQLTDRINSHSSYKEPS